MWFGIWIKVHFLYMDIQLLLEEGAAITSAFSGQNSVSLCPGFILYSKAKFTCYSRYLLTSYFCIPVPYDEKDIFFWILVLEGLVGLHRTIQLQLLQHYWLGHRLGLLWYWMVCLGNEQRSFCCFWDCIQVQHFGPFCWFIICSQRWRSSI